ncbi:securin [Nothobranchius furzeri]|uniref:Securin n=2 Tax=Nothobranchius TaxID=28779 RepID=A0A1A8ACI3_NOTFU|nr:securin [Nothobranchius furzeri]KAF7228385.1 securin-like [Nothobranchius furzeri]
MANILAEQENAGLHVPSLKMRQRLQSAPEKLLNSEAAKSVKTPLPFGRKAFGAVNKVLTPAVSAQEKTLLKPQENKVEPAPQTKIEEYPEIEKFIPYDPLEFERYSVPEDLIPLSCLALPGLACFPTTLSKLCEEDLTEMAPLPDLSPIKMPKYSDERLELEDFLQTLDELTELPPEPVDF